VFDVGLVNFRKKVLNPVVVSLPFVLVDQVQSRMGNELVQVAMVLLLKRKTSTGAVRQRRPTLGSLLLVNSISNKGKSLWPTITK
jgi:hypothetical protein